MLTPDTAGRSRAGARGPKGRRQFFEQGMFPWSPRTGAHVVHGAIHQAFHASGHERTVGHSVDDEVGGAGGEARRCRHAAVLRDPDNGTWNTVD
ncbi:hypothetical protein ACFC1R_06250 [Kitasatospora sp. NPDC056138]|uniref:hypothetical protein n=1 Tax=Kitasatospora sp. NPDC056138 TaxID=3345724 RepID=UPI0035E08869